MNERELVTATPKAFTTNLHDVLIDGEIVHDVQARTVFVSSQSELSNFTNVEPIGTVAVQYGLANIWQLNANREWVSI